MRAVVPGARSVRAHATAVALFVAGGAASGARLAAQGPAPTPEFPPAVALRLDARDRAKNLAVNAVVGAGVAGVRALVARRPLGRALLLGAAAGTAAGVGKQVIGGRAAASGLAGRALAVAGTSLATSAALPHAYAAVPVGPVLLEWRRQPSDSAQPGLPGAADDEARPATANAGRARWRFAWRVHAVSVGVLAAALARGGRLDAGASAWAGTLVVRRAGARMWNCGRAFSGLIVLREPEDADATSCESRLTLAHEAIHVAQWEQLEWPAALPAERALVQRLPLPRRARAVARHLDLGLASALAVLASYAVVPHECHPGEREAYRLTRDPTREQNARELHRAGRGGC